jgi:hypothetical protein
MQLTEDAIVIQKYLSGPGVCDEMLVLMGVD